MIVEASLLVILVLLIKYICHRSKDMPPGPHPLPIIGNLIQIILKGKQPFESLHKLSEEYGDVITLRMGSTDIVVISSYEALKETMVKDEWCGRLWNAEIQARSGSLFQRIGMIFLDGDAWKEQRRFTIRHLRDFGFGKQASMENVIHEELNEVMSRLRQQMGDGIQTVVHMHTYFNLSVLNVLWSMIAGVRYSHDDKTLLEMIKKTELILKTTKPGGPALMFPILRKLFPGFFGVQEQLAAYADLRNFFRESINSHRKAESYGSSEHFIDVFLQEVDKGKDPDLLYTEEQLIALCMDLFIAGSETTSNTLAFAILYLILHPKVQDKVYEEIRTVIGSDVSVKVSLEDQSNMPYTEATIMEIQRLASIAPLTPPHRTTKDVSYRNYKIPKDTIIFINMYSLTMNKNYWGDSEAFRPERFLDPNGLVKKDERLIPFGIGKRACLGESLAKITLFLYFTTLIKNFKFETVPGHLNPTIEPMTGLTMSPKPYNVSVSIR